MSLRIPGARVLNISPLSPAGRPLTEMRALSHASFATVRRLMSRETFSHLSSRISEIFLQTVARAGGIGCDGDGKVDVLARAERSEHIEKLLQRLVGAIVEDLVEIVDEEMGDVVIAGVQSAIGFSPFPCRACVREIRRFSAILSIIPCRLWAMISPGPWRFPLIPLSWGIWVLIWWPPVRWRPLSVICVRWSASVFPPAELSFLENPSEPAR